MSIVWSDFSQFTHIGLSQALSSRKVVRLYRFRSSGAGGGLYRGTFSASGGAAGAGPRQATAVRARGRARIP